MERLDRSQLIIRGIAAIAAAAAFGVVALHELDTLRAYRAAGDDGVITHISEDRVVCGGTLRDTPAPNQSFPESVFVDSRTHRDSGMSAVTDYQLTWACKTKLRPTKFNQSDLHYDCEGKDWWPYFVRRGHSSWTELRWRSSMYSAKDCKAINTEVRF